MKKAILLYNPKAGNRQIVQHLDYITERLQKMGYELRLFRSMEKGDIKPYIINHITEENTDMILISGGDGTLNECVNGVCLAGLDIPIGILPLGTANDFAYSASIPSSIQGALDVIEKGAPHYVDIGKVNEGYFVNVCNMGLFSGISHVIDIELKKKFGKLAYYVKGIEELQNYRAMDIQLEVDGEKHEGKYILILVFNGKAAGGFTKLAKNASIQDGEFDVICIKKTAMHEIPRIFLKVLQGEHLNDSGIDYFTAKDISIECTNEDGKFITDVDGEEGPAFPLRINMLKDTVRIYLL
ncbi:MAG: YegS/Rv2252/BmrU family lipid kinase [Cellulosilyticaceae bacterium]